MRSSRCAARGACRPGAGLHAGGRAPPPTDKSLKTKYKVFKTDPTLNADGTLTCQYGYDIITSPSDIGERVITDEQGKIFEENLGRAILEIIEEKHIGSDENRNNDTKEFITE